MIDCSSNQRQPRGSSTPSLASARSGDADNVVVVVVVVIVVGGAGFAAIVVGEEASVSLSLSS